MIKRAWNNGLTETKYRSYSASATLLIAPTAIATANIGFVPGLADNFHLPAGGLQLGTNASVADDTWAPKLFVRGGTMTINFCNRFSNLTNVRIKLWLVYARNVPVARINTQYGGITNVASSWDPTVPFDWWETVHAPIYQTEKILESGDAWTVERRLRAFMFPQWFAAQANYLTRMPYWIFSVEPTQSGVAAATVDVSRGYNLSFTGDLNGPSY